MDKNFWKYETLKQKEDIEICEKKSITLQKYIKFIIIVYQLALFGYIAPFLSKGQKLVFECYRPTWLSYYFILFLEGYTCVMTIFLPINATDFLFLIIATQTTIQFMLLNKEFNRVFSMTQEKLEQCDLTSRLRRCIQHHNVLLE